MTSPALRPVAGDGVLARHADLVLICSDADGDVVDQLLAAHSQAGDANALADAVGSVVGSAPMIISAVVFGPVNGSTVVAVFGHAWADVSTEHGDQRLALKQSRDGVRLALSGRLIAVRAGLGDVDDHATPSRWGALGEGVVPAGGLLYVADASSPAPADEPPQITTRLPTIDDVPPSAEVEPADVAPADVAPIVAEPLPPVEPAAPLPPAEPVEPATLYVPPTPPAEPMPAPVSSPEPEPIASDLTAPHPLPPPPSSERPVDLPPPPAPAAPLLVPPASVEPDETMTPAQSQDLANELAQELAASPATTPGPPEMPPVPPASLAVDRAAPFASVVLLGAAAAAPQAPDRPALPVASRPAAPAAPGLPVAAHPVADGRAEVLGVYCKNGHFDDPAARYCAICGISMAQQTLLPRMGPRPPLGVLVMDDGSIFSLDTDYVVGRDPFRDPDVASGAARPLRVDDPEGLLSRVHVRIHLDGWQVQVVDLGSANGTGIWGPQDSAWHKSPPQTALTIRPGTQVGLGRRQLRYESHRNT